MNTPVKIRFWNLIVAALAILMASSGTARSQVYRHDGVIVIPPNSFSPSFTIPIADATISPSGEYRFSVTLGRLSIFDPRLLQVSFELRGGENAFNQSWGIEAEAVSPPSLVNATLIFQAGASKFDFPQVVNGGEYIGAYSDSVPYVFLDPPLRYARVSFWNQGSTEVRIEGGLTVGLWPKAEASKTFTYQGRLTSDRQPVTGVFDLAYSYWLDPVRPDNAFRASRTRYINQIDAGEGLFNAELEYGYPLGTDQDVFLQLEVRYPAGQGPYTALGTRHRVSASPRSFYADRSDVAAYAHASGFAQLSGGSQYLYAYDGISNTDRIAGSTWLEGAERQPVFRFNHVPRVPATRRWASLPATGWVPSRSAIDGVGVFASTNLGDVRQHYNMFVSALAPYWYPLKVPDGAKISRIICYIADDSTGDLTIRLRRIPHIVSATEMNLLNQQVSPILGTLVTSGLHPSTRVWTMQLIDHASGWLTVENENYSYLLEAYSTPAASSWLTLGSVTVEYEVTTPLP